ncbi:MAG: SpoIID/LytB domain-containing protein [Candidatus Omnitrophica bacterium]|nr:SpoIID/LytB domain-containing protein [Candidatus Omnitrophota bacterium]
MKRYFTVTLISAIMLIILPLANYVSAASGVTVRVAIIEDRTSVDLSLKGKYAIYALGTGKVLKEGPYLNGKVTVASDGLLVGGKAIGGTGINIKVVKDSNIYIDTRRFRGSVDIVRKDNGKLLVINNIDMDDYLYGVLYHEVSHRWPAECLKAQAIAARTFALEQARGNKGQPYDLRCDIYSQVYGGRDGEKWSTTHAVDSTRGKVLTFNGDIFPTYYHATCAGYTEDASNLWNADIAPLKGVPCNFCGNSKHYRWAKELPLANVESKLKDSGYKIGHIKSVNILSKNRSGRNENIEIKDDTGTSVVLTGKDFRQIFGPNEIRSTKFDAEIKRGNLMLNGMGWGHGVGMCQWGAYGMALRGKKCDDILKYYYPGTEIMAIDKLPSKP